MRKYLEVDERVIRALSDATKMDSEYVSISFVAGMLAVAVEDIHGYLGIVSIAATEHEEFSLRIRKSYIREIIKPGCLLVKVSDDKKTVTFSIFSNEEEKIPWTQSKIGYSYTSSVQNMIDLLDGSKVKRLNVSKELFISTVEEMMTLTEKSVSVKSNYAYSIGKGLSIFMKLSETTDDDVTIDYQTYKAISRRVSAYSSFLKAGNTFAMANEGIFVTWRADLSAVYSLEHILNLQMLGTYRIRISDSLPFISLKDSKKEQNILARIDFSNSSISIENTMISTTSAVKLEKTDGDASLSSVVIPQKIMKYLASDKEVYIKFTKKIIRIINYPLMIDVACQIELEG